jgi:hypothetical protein
VCLPLGSLPQMDLGHATLVSGHHQPSPRGDDRSSSDVSLKNVIRVPSIVKVQAEQALRPSQLRRDSRVVWGVVADGPPELARFVATLPRDGIVRRDREATPASQTDQPLTMEASRVDRSTLAVLPRKEVIQPQLPLRLPCYDFVLVTNPTLGGCVSYEFTHRLQVLPAPMT